MIRYFFIITLTLLLFQSKAQQNLNIEIGTEKIVSLDGCKLKVSIKENYLKFRKEDDKNITLKIQNLGDSLLMIPEWLVNGESRDEEVEIIFEIEKWNKQLNKYNSFTSEIITDYDYLAYGRLPLSISRLEEKEYKEKIDFCNKIVELGKYRFKLKLRKICNLNEIELDWKEFEVIE